MPTLLLPLQRRRLLPQRLPQHMQQHPLRQPSQLRVPLRQLPLLLKRLTSVLARKSLLNKQDRLLRRLMQPERQGTSLSHVGRVSWVDATELLVMSGLAKDERDDEGRGAQSAQYSKAVCFLHMQPCQHKYTGTQLFHWK